MEFTQNLLNNVDVGQWQSWLAVASELVLAVVYVAFLCLIGSLTLARRELALPSAVWLLGVYLGCAVVRHIVMVIFDQSPSGWPAIAEAVVAAAALILLAAVLRLTPAMRHLGALDKMNYDFQREVEQRRSAETSLQQRVSELERINAELEYVSRGVVGREERIMELKREINQLLQRAGEQPRYRAVMELQV